jgi:oxygen-independent coproporphyrinogen III oxidase
MRGPLHPPIGLYIHVPFCIRKCAYCDFASYAGRETDIPRYLDAVISEIRRRGAETGHPKADTIFIGGGTPSLLDESQVTRILDALGEAFPIEHDAEITCECNPGTLGITNGTTDGPHPLPLSRERARGDNGPHPLPLSQRERGVVVTTSFAQALRKAGVNRLSIGAQARQPRLLQLLGRIHNWEQVIASVDIAREAGFDNINLDLMFGLPSQTVADVRETLEAALALAPTHISCYGLIVEQGTPICRDIAAQKLALPDEEVERDMYELVRQTLADHGFEQYEISNFAREGYQCRHNIGCWTRVPYLGFGCAAHSFFNECRTMNPSSLDAYLAGERPKTERISKEEARFESMMLGLRMTRGVSDEEFRRMHGMSIREAFGQKLDKPIAAGLIEWHEGALRLTRVGMDLQNSVLVDLM